jgi:polyphosphate kinase
VLFRSLIRFETEEARAGRPASIFLKTNNLEDPGIINALYEASQAGVQVDGVVRSVTRLRAGVPGLSENIRLHSVVGRFLEHSRMFHFHHAGDEQTYIGSADMMHRNLDARVEVLTPITAPALRKYLAFVREAYLADTRCRWELTGDGGHRKIDAEPGANCIHTRLMEHALKGAKPMPWSQ